MDRYQQQLLSPEPYPETTKHVDYRETHISRVYLTDSHAYKFKKPINLGFLDFTNLAKRQYFCQEEVRLNNRFSSGIYLGIVALKEYHGKLTLGGPGGKIIDYAVKMKKLPEELMLNRMVERDDTQLPEEMTRLGHALHQAFEATEICSEMEKAHAGTVLQNLEENFRQTKNVIGVSLSEGAHKLMYQQAISEFYALKSKINLRARNGFVRDGHGDLHTGNICMTDPICIYDCIEFNHRFRIGDVLADLAFLLMDLDFLGRRDLSHTLLDSFLSHADDPDIDLFLPFYKRYRAWVRGKVDAMLAIDSEAESWVRQKATELSRKYFNLAMGYLCQPTLFLVSGLMGVGKTTLSKTLARATGSTHLRSDEIRKSLNPHSKIKPSFEAFEQGLYRPERTKAVYDTLFHETESILNQNKSVIVDASFSNSETRLNFIKMAQNKAIPVFFLHLHCPDKLAFERLDQRQFDISDGRTELYPHQKNKFEQLPEIDCLLDIDTTKSVDYNVQAILCHALKRQKDTP
jgi:aminoglycoside phosphotransferase family enzyme/gluconate kinase